MSVSGITSAGMSFRYRHSSASHPSALSMARRVRQYQLKSDQTDVAAIADLVSSVVVVAIGVGGARGWFFQYFSIYNMSVNRIGVMMTHYLRFDNLSCLILPVFCLSITCCSFLSLFFCTAPCKLDVCEFVIGVKDWSHCINPLSEKILQRNLPSAKM